MRFVSLYFCQRSTPSFLGFGRLYFSNINSFLVWGLPVCTSPDINSFLCGVCPSVLRQISTPFFLAEIARCSSVPLRHNHMFHLPLPWAGMYSAKRGRDISGHYTHWALCVVLEKRWKAGTPVTGPQRMCLILGPESSRIFLSYWTGMYSAIHQQYIYIYIYIYTHTHTSCFSMTYLW